MSTATGGSNQGRTIERALDVLESLERARGPLRLSEIARSVDLHLATTQRTVNLLVRRGYIQQDRHGYSLGPVALSLAHAFVLNDRLSTVATPILGELSATTGLTSSIFVRSGDERILVARVDGANPLRYQFPIGRRVPLNLGGGKVLLADLDAADLDAFNERVGPARLASGALQDSADLAAQLATVRRNGFHLAQSERELGALSLTRAIHTESREAIGAVNLVTTTEHTTPDALVALLPELARACAAIAERV
ncbi:IclR family transcriptional regulator [Nocardiopsis ansamitocini]|uniref:IclR family transcriptional regulator n=1 Tax=Nocardiopsis ansamitocini TaxID=1670832 RepID=A0A9W6P688_9ACTN|nr:IclR family transcriptional regulator [Nocardiopsis ansamitocini]GLU47811.1 IclR family transcriptional regulator [Nocardiopsis ansamitocini]